MDRYGIGRYCVWLLPLLMSACAHAAPDHAQMSNPGAVSLSAFPALPASSHRPWRRFALEEAMGATCTTRAQRTSSGRSVLLMADECIGPAPASLARVILALPEDVLPGSMAEHQRLLRDAAYLAVPGLGARPDVLLATEGFFIRSFESQDAASAVYLVSGVQCQPQSACRDGLKAFRLDAAGKAVDVTADVLPAVPVLDAQEIARYSQYAEPVPVFDLSRLWTVPVMRWVIELDPDAPLADDPRYYNDWAYVHFGFLVWTGKYFELRDNVDRAHWPCRPVADGAPPCSLPLDVGGDRFVTP